MGRDALMKVCKTCRVSKPYSEFYTDAAMKEGYRSNCKQCYRDARNTPQKRRQQREQTLQRKYALSVDEYNERLAAQAGGCGICQAPPEAFDRSLAVDHCHTTGHIRGILCHKCNRGLGLLGDNLEGLQRAINYLTKDAPQQ